MRFLARLLGVFAFVALSGCGGSDDEPAPIGPTPPAPVAPAITTQPASVAVTAGQMATFSVTATGTAPLAYQWKRDGASIAGATSSTYSIASTAVSDNGARYSVTVTNSAGSVTSNEAVLTVSAAAVALTITTQPASVTVAAGQPATFTVVAAGTAPLTYQWKRNGADIAGANAATYTIASTTTGDNAAQFTVTVGNAAGSVTSSAATLTVTQPTALGTPTLLDTRGGVVGRVRVVSDNAGNATVVWNQNVAQGSFADQGIWARRYSVSTGSWGAEERVDGGAAGSKFGPAVAVDAATGDVVVVWSEAAGVAFARFTALTGVWVRGVAASVPSAGASAVAFDGAGRALALVPVDDAAIAGTQMRMRFVVVRADGTADLLPQLFDAYPGSLTDSVDPLIAANASGNALAVWVRGSGLSKTTAFSRYTASTQTWSAPLEINAPDPVAVTFDDQDNGLLLAGSGLWRYNGTTNRFVRSSGIPTSATITNFNTKLAPTGNGTAVAVSLEEAVATRELIARRYDPATDTWSDAVKITDIIANDFAVGGSTNGEVAVLFDRDGAFATRSAAGSTAWTTPQRVNRAGVTANVETRGVGSAVDGSYVAVWTEPDPAIGGISATDIWGNAIAP